LSEVRLLRGDASATLTIANPARGNAMTPAMMADATRLLAELASDVGGGVCSLVVRGQGMRAFSAGYDLGALADETRERPNLVIPELIDLVQALLAFPGPTIAMLNGHAIGGGALLASLCDLRYARAGVRFRIPTTRIGILYPLAGLRRLVSLVGLGTAARVLMLGDDVSTDEGLAWQLYQGVEADVAALEARIGYVRTELAARAPLALRGSAVMLRSLSDGTPADGVAQLHADWLARCVASRDLAEGLAAARERRPPQFGGA